MYTFTLEASGTGQSSWTASGLPDGLTLEGMTITGTPAVYGEFEVIITVTNETGTDTRTFTLKIYDVSESLNRNAPEITSGAPADGYYKRFYSHTFTARGQTPITWHLSGNVPEGLEIDSGTGRFSGSPKQTGEFAFTVSAANKSGTRSETVKLRVLDVPASMLMYERVCSDPLVLRLSEQKGSGLKTAKIFRDNYRAFRSHRSKDSGVTFVEFIAGTLMDYTASAQFSNMTSLISAVFRGFDKGADFYIEYPDNAHVSQSAMLSDSDSESESESESQIPANIIIGTVGEAHAASLEELSALLSSDELAQITRLEFISSDIQELSRLEGFTGLKALSVRECPLLEQINLSGCASLESLIINNAAVIAIDVSDCVNLAYIDVNECASLETITGLNERLRTLKAAYTSLRELDLTGKGRLASLNLNETKLTSLDLTDCDSLEVISVLNAGNLAVLDLSQCASLVDVYAGGTMIEGFASRSHKSLRKLDLAGCLNLIEIDVANYELLDELVITGARITELDISNCPSLERVNANGCELLSALNHEGCDKLSELSLNGTLFSELDLSGMNALTKLDAGSCALLSELILDDCPNLQELLCPGCALVSLDLTGNNNLAVLDISMNAITNRNLALNSKSGLREFYCSGNSFAYLDLSALNLENAEFVNQTIYGFRSALSLDVGHYVNSEAVKVSNVQAFTQSGDVIPSEYNKSSGIARFEQAPFAVSYEYATGYDNNSVRMDVLLTGAEKPESSNGYLDGTNCGSCNAGFPFAGLAALCVLMFPVKSVKRKKQ
ncbi:MAG: putative Ig domain-containing protein [Synergistaceae bacterium]|nr:putative Ig domain-containing protein [Synergistaceae bacterium]